MLSSLQQCENVRMLTLVYNGRSDKPLVSRCLLWIDIEAIDTKTGKSEKRTLIDRVYPVGNTTYNSVLREYARKNDYLMKDLSGGYRYIFDTGMIEDKEFKVVPYMDTMQYGTTIDKTFHLMSSYEIIKDGKKITSTKGSFSTEIGSWMVGYEEQDKMLEDVAEEEVDCENCGDYFPEDDMVYVEGEGNYCESCRDEYISFCENCNEYVVIDNIRRINPDGNTWCDSCVDIEDGDTVAYCEYCDDWWDIDYTKRFQDNDSVYCDDHASTMGWECVYCGDWYSNNSDQHTTIEGDTKCDNCFDDYVSEVDNKITDLKDDLAYDKEHIKGIEQNSSEFVSIDRKIERIKERIKELVSWREDAWD